ncbi:putative replication initiation protein [Callinectes ornatus blue crab associated circular virus]|uniref:Putative replication initiation protein n=1 Tax=Callinectes ornatus blue crab associated circular virus TaxID=1692245 RepID=A0A0K1RL45_9CIRC|nr:putative replication initiation protein [Callinectes ornatus blue crab associated circular virus]AKV62264.1 putative replication initiation protein [Callinectes ornatus blue crab associated circular virus]
MAQAKRWVFTLNNYSGADEQLLEQLSRSTDVVTLIYGREVAPGTGTNHLQGMIIFATRKRLRQIRNYPPFQRAHLEVMRSTPARAREYCIKDGDFVEYGEPVEENRQGRRNDIHDIIAWLDLFIEENNRPPTQEEVAQLQPIAMLRYRNFMDLARLRAPQPQLIRNGVAREGWQMDLEHALDGDAPDRHILFYVDPAGGNGKTWFQQYLLTKYPRRVQILGTGNFADCAYAVDESKDIIISPEMTLWLPAIWLSVCEAELNSQT